MNPVVEHFFDQQTCTFTYVVFDEENSVGAIIDPVLDFDLASGQVNYQSANLVLEFIEKNALKIEWILETHAHADHLTAAQYLSEKTGAKIAIGSGIKGVQQTFKAVFNLPENFATDGSQFDHCFENNEHFQIGNIDVNIMATPGHTDDSVTYLIGDAAFIGDTMFHPQLGTARCDFPGGDAAVLYQSIQRILSLPSDTRIFLCHDYPDAGREPICQVTIAEQKAKNIHINDGNSETKFIDFRTNRDSELQVPKLLYPSVQVNIAAGLFPTIENNQPYLKIPVIVKSTEDK